MKKLKKLANIGLLLAGVAVAGAGSAMAESNTANLNVELTITPGCSVGFGNGSNGEAGTVNLGSFINLDSPVFGESTLNVRCSKDSNIAYTVALSGGNSGNAGQRELRDEKSHSIAYNIYKDKGHSNIWGDKGDDVVKSGENVTKNGDLDTYGVYVQVPAQKDVALYSGKYSDVVVATVSYNN